MARVSIEGVEKSFGSVKVIRGVDIEARDGEFVVLVGPSGCGKSTLLRMIAGLEEISRGRIRIGDRVVNNLNPKDRDIAMVFQSYALYPHMTASENMEFALALRKMKKPEGGERVGRAASTLGIRQLLDRRPGQLSGGQRQRVAMGRAIVRDPQVFLFDEPLSNLDAKLRVQMRGEIRELHRRLGTTCIYVTHDQIEAMTMADRIVVMHDGVVEQRGPPLALYDRPANLFVASFLGSPSMNFVSGRLSADGAAKLLSEGRLAISLSSAPRTALIARVHVDLIFASNYMVDNRAERFAAVKATLTQLLADHPNSAVLHDLMCAAQIQTNRGAEGIAECERALALNPNLVNAHAQIGFAWMVNGRPEETESHVHEAIVASPRDTNMYIWIGHIATSKLYLGADEDAVTGLRRTLEFNRSYALAHFYLGAALELVGRPDDAQVEVQAGLALDPQFTIRRFRAGAQSDNPTFLKQRERIIQAMQKAGIPEG
jgi:multiple sugar transport system ATP-binding protein